VFAESSLLQKNLGAAPPKKDESANIKQRGEGGGGDMKVKQTVRLPFTEKAELEGGEFDLNGEGSTSKTRRLRKN